MFVELLMKKNGKILFGFFIIVFIATTVLGGMFVYNSLNTSTHEFKKAGYTLSFSGERNSKAEVYSFKNGTTYKLRGSDNTVSFEHKNEKVDIDENTIIHYTDGALGFWKKVVGMDVSTVNNDIIFYYNIYKDTQVNKGAEGYTIKLLNDEKVRFKNLLVRVSDKKFILTGKNIRLVLREDEIVDFGDYVEFEYTDGNVVKVYNQDKYYQTISNDAVILVDDIKIQLNEAAIYKENKQYISLTNLVIDNNGNIDTLEEKIETEKIEIKPGGVETPNFGEGNAGGTGGNGGIYGDGTGEEGDGTTSSPDDGQQEETEDENKTKKTPEFKVTTFDLNSLSLSAAIEIHDNDSLLTSSTEVNIVENQTSKSVSVASGEPGELEIRFDYSGLKPDTEYTLTAKAAYKVDDQEYEKYFVSKIFRTEDIGVSFDKECATEDSLTFEVYKENYSKVESVKLTLYDGEQSTEMPVDLLGANSRLVTFSGLDSNKEYTIKMSEIEVKGITADNGFTQKKIVSTLKKKPEIGELNYRIDKRNSSFELSANNVVDEDYGVVNYRYEVYPVYGSEIGTAEPVATVSREQLSEVEVAVDGVKIERYVNYTYVLVAEFYDNEKIVEYSKVLDTSMTLEGAIFPTVRFEINQDPRSVTWEQINGSIIIDDPNDTIEKDEKIKVVYKNSIDVNHSENLQYDEETGVYPLNVNNLRTEETYTFFVYATVDLKDGQGPREGAYIGAASVQTEKPRNLKASFKLNESATKAFDLNVQLDSANQDASLEASTLKSMTFTIYSGANTTGEIIASMPVYDTIDDDYNSSIGNMYYNNMVNITPEFFDTENEIYDGDDIYTIEISKVYDYTDHKNEITVEKNTYKFKKNQILDDLPEGDERYDSVTVNNVTNGVANSYSDINLSDYNEDGHLEENLSTNPDLNSDTIVGYLLSPNYKNTLKNAVYVRWIPYLVVGEFDPLSGEEDGSGKENDDIELTYLTKIVNYEYTGKENDKGTLEKVLFKIENGTKNDEIDYCADAEGNAVKTSSECADGNVIGLRRGNSYYFKYEIYLDGNNDGKYTAPTAEPEGGESEPESEPDGAEETNEDYIYPYYIESGSLLTSKELEPVKQRAKIKMYPSSSTGNTYTWKYIATDIDKAMDEDKLYSYQVDGAGMKVKVSEKPIVYEEPETFKEIVFDNLSADQIMTIAKAEYIMKPKYAGDIENYKETEFVTQYFDGENVLPNLEYEIITENNNLIIKLDEEIYETNKELIDSLGKVDIVFTAEDGSTKTIDSKGFSAGKITISLFEVSEFLGKKLTVDVNVYYDSGLAGFDIQEVLAGDEQYKYVALQNVSSLDLFKYYIYSGGTFTQNTSVGNGMYIGRLEINGVDGKTEDKIIVKDLNSEEIEMNVSLSESGFEYKGAYVVYKAIATKQLASDSNTFDFDFLIPGIKVRISPSVGLARIKTEIEIPEGMKIKCAAGDTSPGCEVLYFTVEMYDEKGKNPQPIESYNPIIKTKAEIEADPNGFLITNLTPNRKFRLKIYAEICNEDETKCLENEFQKPGVGLYDLDRKVIGYDYVFYTKENINITNVGHEFIKQAYTNKQLKFEYDIDSIDGFEIITNSLYKLTDGGREYISGKTISQLNAHYSNSVTLDANPKTNKNIEYNTEYEFVINITGKIINEDGEEEDYPYGSYTYKFKINPVQEPYIGVSSSREGESMKFTVAIEDPDYIIMGNGGSEIGQFEFDLTDSSGNVIEDTYAGNRLFKIQDETTKAKIVYEFVFENVEGNNKFIIGEEYTFIIKTNLDTDNDSKKNKEKTTKKKIIFGDFVDAGQITTGAENNIPSKIAVVFEDTYKLDTATWIQYTISSTSGETIINKSERFGATADATGQVFKFVIDLSSMTNQLTPGTTYIIGLNFYAGENGEDFLTSAETRYYYTG